MNKRELAYFGMSAVVVGALVWGCGPPEVVPVVMPGSRQIPVIPEGEAAEALGEQMAQGTVQNPIQADLSLPLLDATAIGETRTNADKLAYTTLKPGAGDPIKPGQKATVHYVGTLENGTKFDSSRDRNEPYQFQVGASPVIRGWHQGVCGMRVGEVRKLTVPAPLGYGSQGRPPVIPPNATLVFEIELISKDDAS